MSDQQSNSSMIENISVNPSVPVIASAHPMGVQLSDIPVFSLGPSLYDYVRTFEHATSSIASRSPPGTPPPNPTQIDQHLNGSSLNTGQVPISISDCEEIQVHSRIGMPSQTCSSQMSHTDRSATSAPVSLSVASDSFQLPKIASITTATEDNMESNHMNTRILADEVIGTSTVICTSKSNSNQCQAVGSARHKYRGPQIETGVHPSSERTDKGNPAEHCLEKASSNGITKHF